VALFVVVVFLYLGLWLKASLAPARPGKVIFVHVVLVCLASLIAFAIDEGTYVWVLEEAYPVGVHQSYTEPNPITPIMEVRVVITFFVILFLTRKLRFDLIVLGRIYPPIPPFRRSSRFSSSHSFSSSFRPCHSPWLRPVPSSQSGPHLASPIRPTRLIWRRLCSVGTRLFQELSVG